MSPVMSSQPTTYSRHYQVLADYACGREGSDIFFFLNRKIVYGGKIYGNPNTGSFFLNGRTSPMGRAHDAELFWDESVRPQYKAMQTPGVFQFKDSEEVKPKAQPFMFQFKPNENTGKFISSDDLYFELGQFRYPLPSNSIQGMSFCTLTPGEVSILNKLLSQSTDRIDFEENNEVEKSGEGLLFDSDWVSIHDTPLNEAQLEFTILASLAPFESFLQDKYVLCRQVPISPFKPSQMDRADICLYSLTQPIQKGTIPNVIIELKKDAGNKNAYNQVERYLRWIKNITNEEEYSKIMAYIIAPRISRIWADEVSDEYKEKIKLFSINDNCFVPLKQRNN